MTIGVLALQGDLTRTAAGLKSWAPMCAVKKPEQLDEIDGLVIPGGESRHVPEIVGQRGFEKLKEFVACQAHLRDLRRRDLC